MWDFSISKALGLMVRTAPFILFRVLVYSGISVALILMTATGAGIGYGVGLFGDEDFRATSTFWGGTVGFGLTACVIFFLRDYILYLVKAGHIAVLVELLDGKDIPGGIGQITYAKAIVTDRFGQASAIPAATGGVLVNSFASVPIGNLVATIVDAIGEVTSTIDLSFFHTAAAGVGVSFTCTDPLGCTDVEGGASRTFDVTFTGLAPGLRRAAQGRPRRLPGAQPARAAVFHR